MNAHGSADGWRALLRHLVEQKAAKFDADKSRIFLRYSPAGATWVETTLRISEQALGKYRGCAKL